MAWLFLLTNLTGTKIIGGRAKENLKRSSEGALFLRTK
jgi:hypothetical protein